MRIFLFILLTSMIVFVACTNQNDDYMTSHLLPNTSVAPPRIIYPTLNPTLNPTPTPTKIPIIEPTPSSMYCQNEIYVESYPQLDELSSNQLLSDESGIEYFIFDEGEIEKPNLDYLVTAKYTGWLENGCVFDSSYTRNTDSVFPLDRVIKGWQLGLSKIGKNGKILIKIPPNLGYGTQGAPPRIPGNSTLFFFVELVDLQSDTTPTPSPPTPIPTLTSLDDLRAEINKNAFVASEKYEGKKLSIGFEISNMRSVILYGGDGFNYNGPAIVNYSPSPSFYCLINNTNELSEYQTGDFIEVKGILKILDEFEIIISPCEVNSNN